MTPRRPQDRKPARQPKPKPVLEKVQVAAQFSLDLDGFREPGTFGPVEMTARDWATFDLQKAIEKGVAAQDEE